MLVALMGENSNLKAHVEEEVLRRTTAQSELKNHLQEITAARSTEKQNNKVSYFTCQCSLACLQYVRVYYLIELNNYQVMKTFSDCYIFTSASQSTKTMCFII